MNIFERIRKYYEEEIDWQPNVKREWVEDYLRHLKEQSTPAERLEAIWLDMQAFMFYQDRSGHHNLWEMPYWEYTICLEWMEGHVFSPEHELTLENAKRFLGNLLDFYKFLTDKKRILDCDELARAYREICGGTELNLIQRIPYTGDETYTAISMPGKAGRIDESFTMSDHWIMILYISSKRSWRHLVELAKKVPSSAKKMAQIQQVRNKLKRIGYMDAPEKLMKVYGQPTHASMDDASRWFFGNKRQDEL